MPSLLIATVPSVSKPDSVSYTITRDSVTGLLSCDCPSRKNPCPHIANLLATLDLVPAVVPVVAPVVVPIATVAPAAPKVVTPKVAPAASASIAKPVVASPKIADGKVVPTPPKPWLVFAGWYTHRAKDGTITDEAIWVEADDSTLARARNLDLD